MTSRARTDWHRESGRRRTPEYRTWVHMRERCNNPKSDSYAGYGGRGIRVCARWAAFRAFLADMGRRPSPRHSIERIDNSGDYGPSNCRWATPAEQSVNKRTSVLVVWRGQRLSVTQWERHFGVSRCSLSWRLRNGWTVDEAFRWAEKRTKVAS